MVKTTMYPPQGESIPMSSVESYAGKIEGNALVFTYFCGMPTQDINEMSKVEPYVVYYLERVGNVYHGGRKLCSRYVEKNSIMKRIAYLIACLSLGLTSCEEKSLPCISTRRNRCLKSEKRVNCVS